MHNDKYIKIYEVFCVCAWMKIVIYAIQICLELVLKLSFCLFLGNISSSNNVNSMATFCIMWAPNIHNYLMLLVSSHNVNLKHVSRDTLADINSTETPF